MSREKAGGAVAPKERINITYKPTIGNAKDAIELPLKALVIGDWTQQPDDRTVEARKPVNINSENFDQVLKEQGLKLSFTVKNHLVDGKNSDLDINLAINSLSDLTPDKLMENVTELKEILNMREALQALKGPLGNVPLMRRTIHNMLTDDKQKVALMKELGIKPEA